METIPKSRTGIAASIARNQPTGSAGPRRSALIQSKISGTQIQGSTNSASPAQTAKGAKGWKRSPPARSPWKAKDAQ